MTEPVLGAYMDEELSSQPQVWAQAQAQSREEGLLPAKGQKIAGDASGQCRQAAPMPQPPRNQKEPDQIIEGDRGEQQKHEPELIDRVKCH